MSRGIELTSAEMRAVKGLPLETAAGILGCDTILARKALLSYKPDIRININNIVLVEDNLILETALQEEKPLTGSAKKPRKRILPKIEYTDYTHLPHLNLAAQLPINVVAAHRRLSSHYLSDLLLSTSFRTSKKGRKIA